MQKYRRVTYEDRCHIAALLQAKKSVLEISRHLGFHKSTVYRELKRNGVRAAYSAERAAKQAGRRYRRCRRKQKITPSLKGEILAYLEYGWSPEQLCGRLEREKGVRLSHQTIYRALRKKRGERRSLRRDRRRGGGRNIQKKASQKNRIFISERPKIVDQRSRIGDWERDGMYGANRKQLLVFTERKSRLTKISYMGTGKSSEVRAKTESTLKSLGRRVFTVTNDNGTEFNDSASMPYKVYHCEPNKPQQRGTVENTIGLLRQYISRKTDLEALKEEDLRELENRINFRPRKCLGYKTPFEVFFRTKVALVV